MSSGCDSSGTDIHAGEPGANGPERCSLSCLKTGKCLHWPNHDCPVLDIVERRLAANAADTGDIDWVLFCRALYARAVHDIDLIYSKTGKNILAPMHRLHATVANLNNVIPECLQRFQNEAEALKKRVAYLESALAQRKKE